MITKGVKTMIGGNIVTGLSRVGRCRLCKQEVIVQADSKFLPAHKTPAGKDCANAGRSFEEIKYEVLSSQQASLLAQAILEDNTQCLSGSYLHTLACNDGQECAEERDRRAKALAEYFLRTS